MANENRPARMKRSGLGKGIENLKPKATAPSVKKWEEEAKQNGGIREIALDDIFAYTDQPRKYFDEEALEELADSIRQVGWPIRFGKSAFCSRFWLSVASRGI